MKKIQEFALTNKKSKSLFIMYFNFSSHIGGVGILIRKRVNSYFGVLRFITCSPGICEEKRLDEEKRKVVPKKLLFICPYKHMFICSLDKGLQPCKKKSGGFVFYKTFSFISLLFFMF